jgi:hypothetical protein
VNDLFSHQPEKKAAAREDGATSASAGKEAAKSDPRLHFCAYKNCGRFGMFGFGGNGNARGRWACFEHRDAVRDMRCEEG